MKYSDKYFKKRIYLAFAAVLQLQRRFITLETTLSISLTFCSHDHRLIVFKMQKFSYLTRVGVVPSQEEKLNLDGSFCKGKAENFVFPKA